MTKFKTGMKDVIGVAKCLWVGVLDEIFGCELNHAILGYDVILTRMGNSLGKSWNTCIRIR